MLNEEEVRTTREEWAAARGRARHSGARAAAGGLVVMPLVVLPAMVLANAAAGGRARYPVTLGLVLVFLTPLVYVLWRSAQREIDRSDALMGAFDHQLTKAVEVAQLETARRREEMSRQQFESRLANALEMADGEPEVISVVEQALARALPGAPAELLLADNSQAHLLRTASSASTSEVPGCPVDSPDHCPAARRAQIQRFEDSDDLDACPKLRGRVQGACSAVCVPVSIMGRTVGVIHATGPAGKVADDHQVADLSTLANLAGNRIGLLRMMAETQLAANTDSLTGLLNRRSLETGVQKVRSAHRDFAVAMADLDHFKELNDIHGHETGDRALRLFARTLRSSLRSYDLVSRHGGEEFVVVLPDCSAEEAGRSLDGVRERLASAVDAAGLPGFTVSFGVVDGTPTDELVDLLARADEALFHAKREGRDRVVIHGTSTGMDRFDHVVGSADDATLRSLA